MTNPRRRLTIDDFDPGWAEDHAGRLADVHGAPPADGHWWSRDGHPVDSYETGASCGGCHWRPDGTDVIGRPTPPVVRPRLH